MTYSDTATSQRVEGKEARDQEHTHPPTIHDHDHYHVTHRHTGGLMDEFEHRTHYHRHEHNHAPIVHGHEHDADEEVDDHAKEAHVHDHDAPTGGGL